MTNLKLINMRDVAVQTTEWLWYPYIPFGKLTIMQGDGGDGKTTTALQIAAAVTTGSILPESQKAVGPFDVIFPPKTAWATLSNRASSRPGLTSAGSTSSMKAWKD